MKKYLLIAFSAVVLVSCGSSKNVVVKRTIPTKTVAKSPSLKSLESNYSGKNSTVVNELLKDAQKYLGAPYRYAGNTSAGFDCSGLVTKVFDENSYKLPRRSEEQSNQGVPIKIKEAKPGDLVFFATSGGSRVNHVGIVHDIGNDGEIKFIHSSTSKGVIISSLNEKYWNNAYLFARRVL
ncbi:NlpC/P60 family protein [Kaistella flava (ex Peng et al. 2021)]|uniref:NlpC/P60 family protein n=1 Tax=Kaistella flava (ex Peng et al. 2021) TaxID=2038776 RepID=A0A7M2Y770_9FLAO|nr:C40 family peptidase [Kaistella flava (ex Peng et al. 2021)]QOW09991.1 NlpC/P60 family protein [Kaistella flava (ex Peng et al. 2021)]